MSKKQKTTIIAGVSAVLILALVLLFASLRSQVNNNSSGTSAYQRTTVQRGTLISTVEGTGTVASMLSANLTWLIPGQVDQVNAKIGDQVKAGDVLATLLQDSTQSTLESSLVTAQENLAQLTSPSAIATAQQTVANDEQAVYNAQAALNNLTYQNTNTAAIQNALSNLVLAQNNLSHAQDAYSKIPGDPSVDANKANAYQTLYSAQLAYGSAEANYNLTKGHANQMLVDADTAALALAKAKLVEDQNLVAALTDGQVLDNATGTSMLQLAQAKLAVQTAQDNLNNLEITAPFNGTITQTNVIPNALVTAGTNAFRIDDLSNLVIDVQVVEIDINHVQVGQPASITFDAIPNKTYTGKVIKTDLAGTTTQTSVNFIVTVQLTDADAMVKPGMSANVTIVTDKVENALLVPSTSIFTDNNGQPFVYVVQNGGLVKVPVTVGAVSDSATQIIGNTLFEGDTIVLSFASSSSSSGNGFGLRLGGGGGVGNTQQAVPVPGKPQVVATP
ncbi:MAG: efflux RND transporter periplasmic adaptor subunit [Anaerolineales bacterium]|jgi:HlyD family secretion protein